MTDAAFTGIPNGPDRWASHSGATPEDGRSRHQSAGRKYPVSEFIRPLSPDSHQDVEPTSSAGLSIVLEPAPDPTIAELVRSLVTAIFNAVSGRTSAWR